MKKFYYLHIHSSFSSFSSGDACLYKEFETKTLQEEEVYGDDQVQVFKLPPHQEFYKRHLNSGKSLSFSYKDTPEFKALVKSFTDDGWKLGTPKEVSAYFDREEAKRKAQREKQGFIVIDQEQMAPEDYHGGFSKKVLKDNFLKKYLERGIVFGYMGNEFRTIALDKALEKEVLSLPKVSSKYSNVELFACWLTSTDGRHFSDRLEDPRDAKRLIKSYAPNILKTALEYKKRDDDYLKGRN